ncbi:MAG TPA: hypothetical protein VFJ57_09360 [Solirubrobacterales bacterium]|nr:hypothetical protein [Solirubrobacterales bacterium]
MSAVARRGRGWLCAGVFLASLLVAPAAAQAAGWLPYKFASPPKVEGEEVQVGADAKGNVTAIWRNDTNFKDAFGTLTISSSLLTSGAKDFAAPVPVAPSTAVGSPRLGVTANGTAVAVWERNNGSKDIVEGATRALGAWGSVTELTDSGDDTADYLTLRLAGNGQGLVAWRTPTSPYRNKVRLINAGNFAPPPSASFPSSPYTSNKEPAVAVSDNGAFRYLLGDKNNPSSPGQTLLNLFTESGPGWSEGTQLSNSALRPQVAAAPNGEPVSAWMEGGKVMLKRGTDPGEAITVANPAGLSYLALDVGPATEEFPNGMVVAAWLQFVDDGTHACCDQVRAAVGNGTTMGPPLELSDELEDVEGLPYAAVGPDGTGYVAWSRFDGGFWVPQVSVRPPGEAFDGVPDDLSLGDAYVTDLQVAPDGRALVGLRQIDEADNELYWRAAVSIYEPGPPAPKGSGAAPLPAPAVAGPPPADTTAPKLKLQLSRKTFATGSKLNKVAVEHGEPSYVWKALQYDLKVGTRLAATLSEPATLTIRVDKTGCVTATPGNPHRNLSSKCRQADANLQHRTAEGKKGLNQFTYLGDWTGSKVKPGARYEFEVIAFDKAGNASRPQHVAFQVDGKPSESGF